MQLLKKCEDDYNKGVITLEELNRQRDKYEAMSPEEKNKLDYYIAQRYNTKLKPGLVLMDLNVWSIVATLGAIAYIFYAYKVLSSWRAVDDATSQMLVVGLILAAVSVYVAVAVNNNFKRLQRNIVQLEDRITKCEK